MFKIANRNQSRGAASLAVHCAICICAVLVFVAVIKDVLAEQGKVVEFGIYSDDYKLLEKTTTIPISDSVRFGFCFEADIDFPEDRYMLVESLEHPPVPAQGGGTGTGYSVPRMFKVRDGVAHGCAAFRARGVADLRPGLWKFSISDGAQVLVVQEFLVQ